MDKGFKHMFHHVGIDEVGRGPLAGPVTLCACKIAADFPDIWFEGIKDSKKLTEKKREDWFTKAQKAKSEGIMEWVVVSKSAQNIDERGIAVVIKEALAECLEGLKTDPTLIKVFLDGSLYAPAVYINQETIIKGDEKVAIIGMASIIAKVTRDGYMDEMAKKYPDYGFEKNKGYGTTAHCKVIQEKGPTSIHRRSFLRNILK